MSSNAPSQSVSRLGVFAKAAGIVLAWHALALAWVLVAARQIQDECGLPSGGYCMGELAIAFLGAILVLSLSVGLLASGITAALGARRPIVTGILCSASGIALNGIIIINILTKQR